jgi:hypothetical protein
MSRIDSCRVSFRTFLLIAYTCETCIPCMCNNMNANFYGDKVNSNGKVDNDHDD